MEKYVHNKMSFKNRSGISLIALIIIIAVLIILASAVVLTTIRSGIFDNTNKTVFLSDIDSFRDELTSYHSEQTLQDEEYYSKSLQADKDYAEQNTEITAKNIQDIIPSMSDKYAEELLVVDGKLVFTGESEKKKQWLEEIGVQAVEFGIRAKVKTLGMESASIDVSIYGKQASKENIKNSEIYLKKSADPDDSYTYNGVLNFKDSEDKKYETYNLLDLENNTMYDVKIEISLKDEIGGKKYSKVVKINTGNGNGNNEVDIIPPTLKISSDKGDLTNARSITYTFKFSESVKGFEKEDIQVTNGEVGAFIRVDAKTYTAVVTNSGSCTQTVTVPSGCCTDLVGNENEEESKVVEIDRTNPTAKITADVTDITNKETITYTIEFSEDVKNFSASGVRILTDKNVGMIISFSGSGRVYTVVAYSPGATFQQILISKNVCTDLAGNPNEKAEKHVIIDRVSPTLEILSDKGDLTNASSITYTFKFSEDVVGFEEKDISVSNGTKGTFKTVSAKEYTLVVTNSGSCTQTVTVPAGCCTDSAGNSNTASTKSITIDRTSPTVSITASPRSNPTNASSIRYTFKFSEDVKGFESGDILVANGTEVTFGTVGTFLYLGNGEYELVVTNSGSCTQTVTVPSGCCTDSVGNSNTAATKSVTIDRTPPVLNNIKVTSPSSGTYASGQTVTIVAEYSENVYGSGKATLTSSTVPVLKIKFGTGTERTANFSSVSSNKITYTYTISSTDEGVLATTGYSGSVYDAAGNVTQVGNKTLAGNGITALTVAQNLDSGKYYSNLQTAVNEVSKNQRIILKNDIDAVVTLKSEFTLLLDSYIIKNTSSTQPTVTVSSGAIVTINGGSTEGRNIWYKWKFN